ncbi:hypothetical protein CP978_00015 [Streptomyces nodosus]|uniref:Uncharacterized protein n=1 Tax=Streptomyces nodosus TaxID=40318 RepID=A0A5P2VUY6_9ACTN|nr:hypothetical protein CP978_00015 [Streptomyces nodosus]
MHQARSTVQRATACPCRFSSRQIFLDTVVERVDVLEILSLSSSSRMRRAEGVWRRFLWA